MYLRSVRCGNSDAVDLAEDSSLVEELQMWYCESLISNKHGQAEGCCFLPQTGRTVPLAVDMTAKSTWWSVGSCNQQARQDPL